VIDGDGLWFVSQNPELVRGHDRFMLTPNFPEMTRINASLETPGPAEAATRLGVTILAKGPIDIVAGGGTSTELAFPGSPRRVGGQGDILAGVLGLFLTYCPDYVLAAAAAAEVTRSAARRAFAETRRGVITSDIINHIPLVIRDSWHAVEGFVM
jgi:ATP-dependent NAD(P)H-hydrate dehydratase